MILVTGSTGFVGRAVVKKLTGDGLKVREITRNAKAELSDTLMYLESIDETTNWGAVLDGVESVIHCAAHVHQMKVTEGSSGEYRKMNVEGTVKLANECIKQGVSRLVFVSTIKVCGEYTETGFPFGPECPRLPEDEYAKSKAIAEERLENLAMQSNLEVVIVRPPLVYGPEAKGNLRLLCKLVRSRLPIPLAGIKNRRSLVGLDNLADFLCLTASHPKAVGQVFHVSDEKSFAIDQILQILSVAMYNKKIILFNVPLFLLGITTSLLGKKDALDRLTKSLEVDSSNCVELLGWKPPTSAEQSVASLVN